MKNLRMHLSFEMKYSLKAIFELLLVCLMLVVIGYIIISYGDRKYQEGYSQGQIDISKF